ncbi:MAG TPA: hypothetical protein VHA53_10705 [Nitrolancea sp.]|nr:hypothetical protein [Nitrolancea sp.]
MATIAIVAAGSAFGGGIAMLIGVIEFPLDWLDGSLFDSYVIPAIVLVVVVGGSQLFAALALRRHERWGAEAAIVAGAILMGWIVAEIAIVGSEAGVMRTLQLISFSVGLVETILAARLSKTRLTAVGRER